MQKIQIKTSKELSLIIQGGKRLAEVKHRLFDKVAVGVSAWEIEELANTLIKKTGGEAGFTKVPGYQWATCVNINEGVVHGIPKKEMIFKDGDVVSVDVGLYYEGLNTDTSFSKGLNAGDDIRSFLSLGSNTLDKAISKAVFGNRIFDISKEIEESLKKGGCNPVRALVGHGVGKNLHEDPQIPQFVYEKRDDTPQIPIGAVLAIEIIYSLGSGEIKYEKDGWTIVTADDKISALYEDTVVVTKNGNLAVTR